MFTKRWKNVLGMNSRTLEYISRSNSDSAIRLANNKLRSKKALQKAGLATPRLHSVVRSRQELKRFRWTKLPSSFALKPNASYGGGGIMVIFGRNKKGNWVKADKTEMFIPELKNHVLDIVDGNFSKGNVPDIALFEQRVKVSPELKRVSVKGIPDIRVLVYNGVPVMAMLRLPTEESTGRANLHTGGIGVGLDISQGITTNAIQYGRIIETLPGTRTLLAGIAIPEWNKILLLATRAADTIGLQFAGVDIAIDREDGPLVLEVNARPGLEIQFANLSPLKSRLRRVEGFSSSSLEKKIRLAKELFGEDMEQEIEEVSGKSILGIEEVVSITDGHGEAHTFLAKIDTGAYRTAIDEKLAEKLSLDAPIIHHKRVRSALGRQLRPVVDVKITMRGRDISTRAFLADRDRMNYDIIIGRRDMKGFLVDPSKNKKARA